MKPARIVVGLAIAGLILGLAPPLDAGGGSREKAPSASSVLTKSYKALRKARGYQAKLSVRGGVTNRKDHRVAAPTVRRDYSAEVYDSVMALSAPRIYRTSKKGAIRHSGVWKALLAADEGVTVDRLFSFPEELLASAIKHRKTAKWHAKKTTSTRRSARGDAAKSGKDAEKSGSGKRRGKTVVKKDPDGDAGVSFPGVIRVEAPAKEALQHVLTVQNSGCFGGG